MSDRYVSCPVCEGGEVSVEESDEYVNECLALEETKTILSNVRAYLENKRREAESDSDIPPVFKIALTEEEVRELLDMFDSKP